PSSGLGSQVVVHGRVRGQMSATEYHLYKKNLVQAVMESYRKLAAEFEVLVLEGAGSCCEVNLRKGDLVNFALAKRAGAPCVIVADIDRGGVFAQILGSMNLMTRREKELTAGFIINKFRGDPALFQDGLGIIERRTRRPVFGVTPFFQDIFIDPEDSVAVQADKRPAVPPRPDRINAAVVKLPGLSNFTDLEALEREPDVLVNYLHRAGDLAAYDLLVLPGTKNVMEDAAWLARSGWSARIKEFTAGGGFILGLCGGYQLLGREIYDPLGVESPRKRVAALGLFAAVTVLAGDKVLRRVTGRDRATGGRVTGYEIHMGRTGLLEESPAGRVRPFLVLHEPGRGRSWEDGLSLEGGRVLGTYVHGLLDSPAWRRDYLNRLRRRKGLPERRSAAPARGGRFHQYDRLADLFEQHVDVGRIMEVMGL
ncbi:MAG: cobyric acid synthase, partial [Thermodesulfobacteriota bacterium]